MLPRKGLLYQHVVPSFDRTSLDLMAAIQTSVVIDSDASDLCEILVYATTASRSTSFASM